MPKCTFNNSFVNKYTSDNGDYYCRVVHGILNTRLDQTICSQGCPLYQNDDCVFLQKTKNTSPRELYNELDYKIERGHLPLFPTFEQEGNEVLWKLKKAYDFAANAHQGTRRKGTTMPYFTHLITTLSYAMMLTDDVEVLMASLLHDTVEDTSVTVKLIRNEFGDRIAEFVASETENKRHTQPATETWELRKQENIDHLKAASYECKIIVLADKTANAESMLREWRIHGDYLWKKFNQHDKSKHAWYYYSCANAMKELYDTDVMKIYMNILDELFADVK